MGIGTVEQVDIVAKMKEAYLDYAMSVITARALPDVRDGLKPVQRRILYAMEDMGLRHDRPYKKSARIVGEVLGKYHPHGDEPVYDAMVRMAQDFSMRYPLVDGQGNFGSVDGDNPAAMRYTEARLAALAEEMLADIDKDTVDFTDNFDGSLKEPVVLPSRVPNLLLNGTSGIAVGMATNIPPHNLGELCDAIIYLIERYDQIDDVSVEELMERLPGPDFPTGGIILGKEGIKAAYATGKGYLTVRSKVHTEDLKGGRSRIVVTELPYQVNKSSLIERIAELVRTKKIESIVDLRDESDRQGMRIIIELKRGEDARPTLEQLFKNTPLQTTFGVIMLALVEMTPRLLPLKRALQLFIEHRREVIARRSRFELERAKLRAHILEGLKIALDNLDAVIDTIRRSRTADTALQNLMRKFKLTEIQARAILDMQLRRLAAMERQKIEEEYAEVIQQIAYLEDLLANPRKILFLIREDMRDLKRAYGDARRTHIAESDSAEFTESDLIPDAEVLLALTQRGHIARLPMDLLQAGKQASIGLSVGARDALLSLTLANTKDTLLFFTDQGRVFQDQVHRISRLDQDAKGQLLSGLLSLGPSEQVTAILPISRWEAGTYLTMVTKKGNIKRVPIEEFAQIPASGLTAIKLDGDDRLIWAQATRGGEELVLITGQGQAIRFAESEVRPMGRTAAGVGAIKLAEKDSVVAAGVAQEGKELLIATTRGYAKRSPISDYPSQGRYGKGVLTLDISKLADTGPITAAQVVSPNEEVIFACASGDALRVAVQDVPLLDRSTWGTIVRHKQKVVGLKDDDAIASIAMLGGGASAGAARESDTEEPVALKSSHRAPSRKSGAKAVETAPKPQTASRRPTADKTSQAPKSRSRSPQTAKRGTLPKQGAADKGAGTSTQKQPSSRRTRRGAATEDKVNPGKK